MTNYYSKLYPQSIYRRPKSKEEKVKQAHTIDIKLPDLSYLPQKPKEELSQLILLLNESIVRVILPESILIKKSTYLSKIMKKLGLYNTNENMSKKTLAIPDIWNSIEYQILNNIKSYILQSFTNEILQYFALKISYIVKQYSRHLPQHVSESETDDLTTISQLEFLETFKSWNPKKCDEIWPLAYSRITGAMKDHIRYVTKSDPTRFYDWITDAAYVYINSSKETDFESRIETGVQLRDAMKSLTIREKRIVVAYTKKDMTFQQISNHLNISESQISRIYKKALEKIKGAIDRNPG